MPCYNSIDGEPASVSHRLLTELLRERMGFDGLCISDYGGISNAHEVQRIGETIGETGFLAMEAGMDMEMPKAIGYGEKLKEMFRSGQADTELLDRTVLRVLEAKFRMGLFEQPFAMDGESCKKIFEEKEGGGAVPSVGKGIHGAFEKQRGTSFVRQDQEAGPDRASCRLCP